MSKRAFVAVTSFLSIAVSLAERTVVAQVAPAVTPVPACNALPDVNARRTCWRSDARFNCLLLSDPQESVECSYDRVTFGPYFPSWPANPDGISTGIPPLPPDGFNAHQAPTPYDAIIRPDGLVPLPGYSPSEVQG